MKKVLKVIADILAWVVLIIAFLITMTVFASQKNNGIPNLFGYMPMSVQSNSMSPTFKQGDLIIVKQIDDLYSLKEGDVITFYTRVDETRIVNTHRIIEVDTESAQRTFITRGDNNPVDDKEPAYAADIIGQWTGTKIPGLGKAMDFLRTQTGFFVCIVIPVAIFFIFELYKFIVVLIEVKGGKLTEEDEEEIKRRAVEEYLAKQREAEEKNAAFAKPDAAAEEVETSEPQSEEE